MRALRVSVLALAAVVLPLTARAELLVTPFVGVSFQGQTTLPSPVVGAAPVNLSSSLVIGGAAMWLTSGVLGAEAELAHSPSFFERPKSLTTVDTVTSSRATALNGNVVVALPRSVSRDSLRPYVVGGLGLMWVSQQETFDLNSLDRRLLALNIGGGVIGYLGDHSGVRFDLRRTRSIRDEETPGVRLSFWRATVGVTFRY